MPLLPHSTYRPPAGLSNGHVQTILPSVLRRVVGVEYRRERIETPDADDLDLDWSRVGSNRLAIVTHGLEGNSSRPYILGMVRALNNAGWDALAWNLRGCGGSMNRLLRSYHSGATEDLHAVVRHAAASNDYGSMALVGFSLGGNMTLKYLGEGNGHPDPLVRGAVVFSVPCDLQGSAIQLSTRSNRIYMRRFLTTLVQKMEAKSRLLPDAPDISGIRSIRTFAEFDDRFTAPIHGFRDAVDYWRQSSSAQFIEGIRVPTLIVNALNDPFLSPSCFPRAEVSSSRFVSLEIPDSGGHVGFITLGRGAAYWSESRAVEFLGGLDAFAPAP